MHEEEKGKAAASDQGRQLKGREGEDEGSSDFRSLGSWPKVSTVTSSSRFT